MTHDKMTDNVCIVKALPAWPGAVGWWEQDIAGGGGELREGHVAHPVQPDHHYHQAQREGDPDQESCSRQGQQVILFFFAIILS